ncbi:DUF1080 domain-containing protein [Colwellia sp. UCD-KL20]|uniref:3-keto-disaccharide hydrolase n=1 Tax=Colwellia sp. UCD-KL20 TaxID=1917165 RepID=UPI0009F9B9CE|nr:DUF1080 domain-containing protein [Colwellia sp. UCD-KL20]
MNFINSKNISIVLLSTSLALLSACSLVSTSEGKSNNESNKLTQTWKSLLDSNLSQWDVWIGVPHSSVKGLPEGTYTENKVSHGDPRLALGLNNDVKGVFTMIEENGQPVLHISGEIYGGINTKAEYKNYHLSFQMKWGDKKWAPRKEAIRDSGLLFHCKGEHGAFWKTWKLCQEFQVQESDLGDYIPLGNAGGTVKGKIRSRKPAVGNRPVYDVKGQLGSVGYASAFPEVDKAHGEWNTLELFAVNDYAVFVVNGEVVMAIQDSKDPMGEVLNSGQLQIQSEGAELFYRDIKIKALDALPKQYMEYIY